MNFLSPGGTVFPQHDAYAACAGQSVEILQRTRRGWSVLDIDDASVLKMTRSSSLYGDVTNPQDDPSTNLETLGGERSTPNS